MIVHPQHFDQHTDEIGAKALRLAQLKEMGLEVPAFVVIPRSSVQQVHQNTAKLDELLHHIALHLPAESYAVRSAALSEDGRRSSQAGQFKTELDVQTEDLQQALMSILDHAQQKLGGSLQDFSCIIQVFIEPERSGVTFTRHPEGHREMVIESYRGRGDELVSGQVNPQRQVIAWTDPNFDQSHQAFQDIERHFDWPQDIEWCEANGRRYYLQTRPISSLSQEQVSQQRFLDEYVSKQPDLHYAKTGISETIRQATPLMMDLLTRIYGENGPIHRVYHRLGVEYRDTHFLKLVASDLYVDRQAELKSLYPSLCYEAEGKVKFKRFKGLWTTLKNWWKLKRIDASVLPQLQGQLQKALKREQGDLDLKHSLQHFLADYELVFEINLRTEKALQELQTALRSQPVSLAQILSSHHYPHTSPIKEWEVDTSMWKGNGLDIADQSPFRKSSQQIGSGEETKRWWKSLPKWKQDYLKPRISTARRAQQLRERARWLSVSRVSQLRRALQKQMTHDAHLMPFASLSEHQNGTFSKEQTEERAQAFRQNQAIVLPRVISHAATSPSANQGVSSGQTSGIYTNVSEFQANGEKVILGVQQLSPDLVQHFDHINGIIAERGGLLSHAAIVAREQGIPVVIAPGHRSQFEQGQKLTINGNTGHIERI